MGREDVQRSLVDPPARGAPRAVWLTLGSGLPADRTVGSLGRARESVGRAPEGPWVVLRAKSDMRERVLHQVDGVQLDLVEGQALLEGISDSSGGHFGQPCSQVGSSAFEQ